MWIAAVSKTSYDIIINIPLADYILEWSYLHRSRLDCNKLRYLVTPGRFDFANSVGFSSEPTDVNAIIYSTVRWHCSAATEGLRRIYWKVNGTSTLHLTLPFIPSSEVTGEVLFVTLTVQQATLAYNNSRVQCILVPARQEDGEIISNSAILTLQGNHNHILTGMDSYYINKVTNYAMCSITQWTIQSLP